VGGDGFMTFPHAGRVRRITFGSPAALRKLL
jgi:hypothetical protein